MTAFNNDESPYGIIELTQGKVAIVDLDRVEALSHFAWRAVKSKYNWYAKATIHRDGKQFDISMHRFIARTKFPCVCHHKNRHSLDNRRINLETMTKKQHSLIHANNGLIVKFETTPTK